mmetsp:Transcript_14633/g.37230  ORF Transcript_14633/g.37230 Transcript_14633/m.37230 type:complete len:146 (+) Transcript_14633:102-539(+)
MPQAPTVRDTGLSSSAASFPHPEWVSGDVAEACQTAVTDCSAIRELDRESALAMLAEASDMHVDDLVEAIEVDPESVEDMLTQLIFTGENVRQAWSRADLCCSLLYLLNDREGLSENNEFNGCKNSSEADTHGCGISETDFRAVS